MRANDSYTLIAAAFEHGRAEPLDQLGAFFRRAPVESKHLLTLSICMPCACLHQTGPIPSGRGPYQEADMYLILLLIILFAVCAVAGSSSSRSKRSRDPYRHEEASPGASSDPYYDDVLFDRD